MTDGNFIDLVCVKFTRGIRVMLDGPRNGYYAQGEVAGFSKEAAARLVARVHKIEGEPGLVAVAEYVDRDGKTSREAVTVRISRRPDLAEPYAQR